METNERLENTHLTEITPLAPPSVVKAELPPTGGLATSAWGALRR